eukprot:6473424-Amphidinium_carterae.2
MRFDWPSLTKMVPQGKRNADPYSNAADVPKGKDKGGKPERKGKDMPKGGDSKGAGKVPGKVKDSP